jgi:hypothetical protein
LTTCRKWATIPETCKSGPRTLKARSKGSDRTAGPHDRGAKRAVPLLVGGEEHQRHARPAYSWARKPPGDAKPPAASSRPIPPEVQAVPASSHLRPCRTGCSFRHSLLPPSQSEQRHSRAHRRATRRARRFGDGGASRFSPACRAAAADGHYSALQPRRRAPRATVAHRDSSALKR